MKFETKGILKIAGSTTALLFMSWMFFGHLNFKPNDSKNQFEELVQEFRRFDDYDVRPQKYRPSKSNRFAGDMN